MKYWNRKHLPLNGLLTIIVLAACSVDDATSPAPRLSGAVKQQLLTNGEVSSQVSFNIAPPNASSKILNIDDDATAYYYFGPHKLYVQGGSLCTMSSPYGPQYWLQACTRSEDDANITVKWWTDSQGYARVQFTPDMRFAPAKPATLYLKDALAATKSSSALLYCIDGTTICTNESAVEPALATQRNASTGWVWRLIRHFSGYNVWA